MRLSDTEWTVMRELWRKSPASVRDLFEELEVETAWAYSTVKTILTRLVYKGAVASCKRGNVNWFEPLITEQSARKTALRSLVERAFGGTVGSLVHHLVAEESMSASERKELLALLEEDERLGRGKSGGNVQRSER